MIKVEYTLNSVENEPGPNLYFMGKPADYLNLLNDLHKLVVNNSEEVSLNDLNYVEVENGFEITFVSAKGAKQLCAVDGRQIKIELDRDIWGEILLMVLAISFRPSHAYVEFDQLELREDANVTISSEW